MAWILGWEFIFQWKNGMDSVNSSWTAALLVHGGPRAEEATVAHRSVVETTLW
jgi:hypothetical protein